MPTDLAGKTYTGLLPTTPVPSKENVSITFHWLPFVMCSIYNNPKTKFTAQLQSDTAQYKVTELTHTQKRQLHFNPTYF
jgi:hypothetical protein